MSQNCGSPFSISVNEYWLRSILAPIGVIHSVDLSPGPAGTVQAKITFPTPEQAQAALHFHGQIAPGQPMQVQLPPQEAFMKTSQPFVQPQLGRFPLGVNVDLNSNHGHGNRARIGGGSAFGGQRHRGGELEPTHKNLYVLNLPLDATTDQLAALFGHYGAVVHCVILAMLDAQARRRGFIDMASPASAKEAIEALNGFVWHGYPIEVSYAIVQRSGGPFEQAAGRHVIKRNVPRNRFNTGPRRVPSDAAVAPLGVNRYSNLGAGASASSAAAGANGLIGYNGAVDGFDPTLGAYGDLNSSQHFDYGMAMAATPTDQGAVTSGSTSSSTASIAADPCTLFISGLDPVAILDDEDLRHALEAYGPIQAVSLSRDDNGMSRGFGMVTYAHETSARKARSALDGNMVNGRKVSAHHLPFNRALSSENGPLSVNPSAASSPGGGSSMLPSAMSVLESSSLASSPEYRRGPSGFLSLGTPSSITGSTPGSVGAFPNPTFSTPQPQSLNASSSDFPTYSVPVAPATLGAVSNATQRSSAGIVSYHLPFSPENWSKSSNHSLSLGGSSSDLNSGIASGDFYGNRGNATGGKAGNQSGRLAEPFVHRSGNSGMLKSNGQEGAGVGLPLGSAFESPSAAAVSPSTLKTSSDAFPDTAYGSSGSSRGPLDNQAELEGYGYGHADQGSRGQTDAYSQRPLSRTNGSLGVTLGADVAASIAAAAGAMPSGKMSSFSSKTSRGSGGAADTTVTAIAGDHLGSSDAAQNDALNEITPKLDGQPFPGSVHSTPLNRRPHGFGHGHMYSQGVPRSAGPGGSIGSLGSVSHAGSISALSAASWARTPQSSLSSLEHISPAGGPGASGAEANREGSALAWSKFPGGSVMASWNSPQAIAGSFSKDSPMMDRQREISNRQSDARAPGSSASSLTENGNHSALRSLHQGSPPYSAALDANYRKLPLAPVGHEKSASIASPRARLASNSTPYSSSANAGKGERRQGLGGSEQDLSAAVAGLNIST
ncbi:hypothetical protein OC846_004733 [Tilletia horrida]|uniref:RRM domain-containing protein n=1 Tax=Tilletia horrida TaxID=155126 RepID=A0AAN6GP70_9BASI|nr:hypothetical protein OC846_004733 [Tilletia horrida]